ncbi:MAG: elongation factor P [bacterium]|nr:elongation factor P [bacterium]
MIPVTHLRAGSTFEDNGQPYIVQKYEHTKMGRGTATIKVKARNLKTGTIIEKSFISGARVEEVSVVKRKSQYLYLQDKEYFFMNPKTFEQFSISGGVLGHQAKFLSEGIEVDLLFLEDTPIDIELPSKMVFKIMETDPGVKGNSATNIYKSATLENGISVKVPLFIKAGEKIWVDTRSGEYVERVK